MIDKEYTYAALVSISSNMISNTQCTYRINSNNVIKTNKHRNIVRPVYK